MSSSELTVPHHVAGVRSDDAVSHFRATDPRTGAELPNEVPEAPAALIDRACRAAAEAAPVFAADDARRVQLLRDIADRLDVAMDRLVAAADRETGLGTARLTGEVSRTTAQLRLFAAVVADGSYHDAVIDHADPNATPPRPDIRRCKLPVGPVGVFGASNFPFAFSVAGGDTSSAFAAGCPVVVKAHPAHPETSALVAACLDEAVAAAGLPAGTFSLVHGRTPEVGQALVQHPAIAAIGFTGSTGAGQVLARLGAERARPIPVFAEMGSLNPVVVGPAAAGTRTDQIAQGFVTSMTMGVGQFCTKPGLLFIPHGDAGDALLEAIAQRLPDIEVGVALTAGIGDACATLTASTAALDGVDEVARAPHRADGGNTIDAVLLCAGVSALQRHPQLLEEHFGPTAVVIRYRTMDDLADALRLVPGSLTTSLWSEPEEQSGLSDIVAVLEGISGRVVFDGFPTGVAVGHAMQHGGPFPATTDSRFTSVGSRAIDRWVRPIAFQDAPSDLLPAVLRDGNPTDTWRQVDGARTREG